MLPRLAILHLRQRSLVRGAVLSISAFAASLLLAGFPRIGNLHGSHWQILALLASVWGMAETARCMRRRWSFYHAGVMVLLYSELLILTLTAFLTFYQ
ncbi:MAG: permease [Terracidiphilus sp.]